MSNYVPLSVREGNWRKKVGWQVKELRHHTALKIAPWLRLDNPTPWAYEQACKALWKHRAANEELRNVLAEFKGGVRLLTEDLERGADAADIAVRLHEGCDYAKRALDG